MKDHSLETLEFEKVLAVIGSYAHSALGTEFVLNLLPRQDIYEIKKGLNQSWEMKQVITESTNFALGEIYDLSASIKKLNIEGTYLYIDQLQRCAEQLNTCRTIKVFFHDKHERFPHLFELSKDLPSEKDIETRIFCTFDERDEIKDSASQQLKRLRRESRSIRSGLKDRLGALLKTLKVDVSTHENVITLRNDRYVISLRSDMRNKIKGIIHDTSSTGVTVFVEPLTVVELNNKLREAEAEILREEERILRELTDLLRPVADTLKHTQPILAELDSLVARARFALDFRCTKPDIGINAKLKFRNARHPLLENQIKTEVKSEQGTKRAVVPLNWRLDEGEKTLLVTGPNTGGKTVMVKTIGLVVLLAQSGILPPVSEGTSLPFFEDVFVDIGDEQSLERNLSTFSAHIESVIDIVNRANDKSLVLLDEIGVGTDPEEGSALAASVLLALTDMNCTTVATTHYGVLKGLSAQTSGIINGSLEFDSNTLEPTYEFVKGLPGRSYGLVIAEKLGLKKEIADRARTLVLSESLSLDSLLEEITERKKNLEKKELDLSEMERSLNESREGLEIKRLEFEEEMYEEKKRMTEEARQIYLDARQQIGNIIKELREQNDSQEIVKKSRRVIEEGIKKYRFEEVPGVGVRDYVPQVGDSVWIASLNWKGEVVEVDKECATVQTPNFKLEVKMSDLKPVTDEGKPKLSNYTQQSVSLNSGGVPNSGNLTELHIRGYECDDILLPVKQFIDTAVLAGISSVRIIHGKGQGILRNKVAEILSKDKRVRSFRLGEWNEGGSGVTVVTI